jgi:hypothetical protein
MPVNMNRLVSALAVATLAVFPACRAASKAELQSICDAPNDDVVKKIDSKSVDPSQLNRIMAEEVAKRVSSKDGRALVEIMTAPGVAPTAKAKIIRGEAERLGVKPCVWADWMDAHAGPAPSATPAKH